MLQRNAQNMNCNQFIQTTGCSSVHDPESQHQSYTDSTSKVPINIENDEKRRDACWKDTESYESDYCSGERIDGDQNQKDLRVLN